MDKTKLVAEVAELFRVNGHNVQTSVKINHREIDVRAEETQSLVRKVILIECADYATTVGIDKLTQDITKLRAAKEQMKDNAVIMHVSRNGYTPESYGYANDSGIPAFAFADLQSQLINFEPYLNAISQDPLRDPILSEYQPNRIHFEGAPSNSVAALTFFDNWLASEDRWLTLLGDYGVGKSWTLKRLLYHMVDRYREDPTRNALPLFVPLQRFTKAFDFENLILRTLQIYGVSGVFYSAIEYMMSKGRIVFLLDSFDEMAQHLSRETIRENLKEMLTGIGDKARAIMTSRPNYFEGRSERLLVVEREGSLEWHPLDIAEHGLRTATSRVIQERLHESQFARLRDLTIDQRKKLFEIVLGKNSPSHRRLLDLFERFQGLESLSQRAVIARLLTTVAATIAQASEINTIEGYPLLPDDLEVINESKIFEIVIYNLLLRDHGIGSLSNAERLLFLRAFAVFLQQPRRSFFASPEEIRNFVSELFSSLLRRSDMPEQLLENCYRTCRRHSGLTTEGQFRDSTGQLDFPVDETDADSRVGFSHNSLREFLVADSIAAHLKGGDMVPNLYNVVITNVIGDFVRGISEYSPEIRSVLRVQYSENPNDRHREVFFAVICAFIRNDPAAVELLGEPPVLKGLDISDIDFSGLDLRNASFYDCVALDSDFRKSDLRGAVFSRSIIENIALDGAIVVGADFRSCEIESIYVFDEYDTKTSSILTGRSARQWLFSHGAHVSPDDDLNPLLGKDWYEAAREVTKTLNARIGGSHQDVSLAKGTKAEHREFAKEFVEFMKTRGILTKIKRSDTGPGYVVKINKTYWRDIEQFSVSGTIGDSFQEFFDKKLTIDRNPS